MTHIAKTSKGYFIICSKISKTNFFDYAVPYYPLMFQLTTFIQLLIKVIPTHSLLPSCLRYVSSINKACLLYSAESHHPMISKHKANQIHKLWSCGIQHIWVQIYCPLSFLLMLYWY